MEFYYYTCGEDRNGYNVFATEQECTKTCVPQGTFKTMSFIQAESNYRSIYMCWTLWRSIVATIPG